MSVGQVGCEFGLDSVLKRTWIVVVRLASARSADRDTPHLARKLQPSRFPINQRHQAPSLWRRNACPPPRHPWCMNAAERGGRNGKLFVHVRVRRAPLPCASVVDVEKNRVTLERSCDPQTCTSCWRCVCFCLLSASR